MLSPHPGAMYPQQHPWHPQLPPAPLVWLTALTVHLEAQPVHKGSNTGVDARFAPLAATITPRGDAVEDEAVRGGVLARQRAP